MTISENKYKIVFTNRFVEEMEYVYNYISKKLYAPNSAGRIMRKIDDSIQMLKYMPKANRIIKKYPQIELEYRRVIVFNYIIIYTIDEIERKVYLTNFLYGKSNYLGKI